MATRAKFMIPKGALASRLCLFAPKLRMLILILLLAPVTQLAGCESVSHESIEKWGRTEKGPKKLMAAFKSSEHKPALRAHAAQKLIEDQKSAQVLEVFREMDKEQAAAILAPLAERLKDLSRINDPMEMPRARQSDAKDALFYLIDFADAPTQAKIADYLVEWFVGGHYEGRASAGRVSGAMMVRRVGKAAAKRLLAQAKNIVSKPPNEAGQRQQVGDELLKALALTTDPQALTYLTQLFDKPRGDTTLPKRVISALHYAYIEPVGLEVADGKALLSIVSLLEELPYDRAQPAIVRNDSVALLRSIGAPDCIPLFTKMVGYPTEQANFRWMGTQQGIRCAGAGGLQAIAEALPTTVDYRRSMLSKYLWDEALELSEKNKILESALRLLKSDSWVARVTGLELLRERGNTQNIQAIKALSGDTHRLKSWWDKGELDAAGKAKSDPTIGEVAASVVKSLQ